MHGKKNDQSDLRTKHLDKNIQIKEDQDEEITQNSVQYRERIYEVQGHQEHVVKANEHLIEYWKDDTENGCG